MNKKEFFNGVKSALPIVMGYMPLGLAFGVLARATGLSVFETTAMSVLVYSGSGQFIAVSLLGAGASVLTIIATTFLVNSRYMLLSASLSPYLRNIPTGFLAFFSFEITDETFGVGLNHWQNNKANQAYMLGLHLTSHLAWITSSIIGASIGNFITDIERLGLNFALPSMFIALLIMQLKGKNSLFVALIAGLISLTVSIFSQSSWNIILGTIAAASVGVIIEKWKPKSSS